MDRRPVMRVSWADAENPPDLPLGRSVSTPSALGRLALSSTVEA
ncbi:MULTISPECIES: hypothetical protein [Microbacterium]|nr:MULTISPECIES: hypothetical protein [Microbacterium]